MNSITKEYFDKYGVYYEYKSELSQFVENHQLIINEDHFMKQESFRIQKTTHLQSLVTKNPSQQPLDPRHPPLMSEEDSVVNNPSFSVQNTPPLGSSLMDNPSGEGPLGHTLAALNCLENRRQRPTSNPTPTPNPLPYKKRKFNENFFN